MQPEGLTNYHIPPVSALDPTSHTQGNQEFNDELQQIVGDEPITMIESDGVQEEMSVEIDDDDRSTVGILQTF